MDEAMVAHYAIAISGILIGVMMGTFANGRKLGERMARIETKLEALYERREQPREVVR